MADNEQDAPENKGVSGIWNATLGREDAKGNNVAVLAAGYSLGNVFCRGEGEAFGALLFLSCLVTGVATVGLETYESATWQSQNDTAVTAGLNAENPQSGYSSVIGDDTYVLFRAHDTWRVYKKSSSSSEGEFVFDPIAALEIVNKVTQTLKQASDMTENASTMTQGSLSALPRDVRFENVSIPYGRTQGERPYVSRFFNGQHSNATPGEAIHARYERLHGVWAKAQSDILAGHYGFTQQELGAMETPERFFDGALTKAEYTGGSLLALWLLGCAGFGIAEAAQNTSPGQRRRKRKPSS